MTAFFPGSFDPFTAGHFDILCRAMKIFDHVVIGVGMNASKKTMFTAEQRVAFIQAAIKGLPNVTVVGYNELTVDYCTTNSINTIIRGIRSTSDYDYENTAAHANRFLNKEVDTIYFPASPEHSFVCSSVVRDIFAHGGDVTSLLPKGVKLK